MKKKIWQIRLLSFIALVIISTSCGGKIEKESINENVANITSANPQNLKEDNGNYTWWKEIREVDKDDIGDDLSHWEQISDNWVPRDDYKMYFNTYERDWASTNKYLGQGEWEGATLNLEGRRTYLSEWYAFDPDNSVSKRMYIQTIWADWAKDFTNSKGRLKIWRVN